MILTTKGRYAVMAIIDIAEGDLDQPTALFTISQRQNISLSYLEQIFTKLRKAEIVRSIKGPGGGYFLNKNPQQITIADIINAIGEPIRMTNCSNKKDGCPSNKEFSRKCKTHDLWSGLEKRIYDYLYSVSLQDVCSGNFPKLYKTSKE